MQTFVLLQKLQVVIVDVISPVNKLFTGFGPLKTRDIIDLKLKEMNELHYLHLKDTCPHLIC